MCCFVIWPVLLIPATALTRLSRYPCAATGLLPLFSLLCFPTIFFSLNTGQICGWYRFKLFWKIFTSPFRMVKEGRRKSCFYFISYYSFNQDLGCSQTKLFPTCTTGYLAWDFSWAAFLDLLLVFIFACFDWYSGLSLSIIAWMFLLFGKRALLFPCALWAFYDFLFCDFHEQASWNGAIVYLSLST